MSHPLHKFQFCPVCGSAHFEENDEKSKRCADCGFVYYLNPSAATAAFILNEKGELLVLTRKQEPAAGTFDLPGGFADMGETAEEGVLREIKEETGLVATNPTYLFTIPNTYLYSGFEVKTLDMFFLCHVRHTEQAHAMDDAAAFCWLPLSEVEPERFGLESIRRGVEQFLKVKK